MTTQNVTLSPTAVTDITADLSLVNGQKYTLQATGDGPVFLAELASAPSAPGGPAHSMRPYDMWPVTQGADTLYAWGRGSITVTEAS